MGKVWHERQPTVIINLALALPASSSNVAISPLSNMATAPRVQPGPTRSITLNNVDRVAVALLRLRGTTERQHQLRVRLPRVLGGVDPHERALGARRGD